jgi:hypothetical protein
MADATEPPKISVEERKVTVVEKTVLLRLTQAEAVALCNCVGMTDPATGGLVKVYEALKGIV